MQPLTECDQPLHRFSFTSDPLTDIQWAVVDSDPLRFVERQKSYSLAIDQTDLFEIEGQCGAFLFQQRPECFHVIPRNPTADAQNHVMLSDRLTVDFASHSERLAAEYLSLAH